MKKVAELLLKDIDKDTVDFTPTLTEVSKNQWFFQRHIPNLLVNGSDGIAVGMAKDSPHNLGEVIDGCVAMIDNPDIALPR